MFAQEHATPFLYLFNLGGKGRHKMCYAQLRFSDKRARHIPPQTDPTVGLLRNMSCSSCVYVIWSVKAPQGYYT